MPDMVFAQVASEYPHSVRDLPGYVRIELAVRYGDGWLVSLSSHGDASKRFELSAHRAGGGLPKTLTEDGRLPPTAVLAGLWTREDGASA